MIVGENARAGRPRRQRRAREAPHQHALVDLRRARSGSCPPRKLSLDQALEFLREDECVEVTPHFVRLRKVHLERRSTARRPRAAPRPPRRVCAPVTASASAHVDSDDASSSAGQLGGAAVRDPRVDELVGGADGGQRLAARSRDLAVKAAKASWTSRRRPARAARRRRPRSGTCARRPARRPASPGRRGRAARSVVARRRAWWPEDLHAGVVGGEEARLLVAEVLVEGLARDAGALDDVGDGGGAVALARRPPRRSRRAAGRAGRRGPPRARAGAGPAGARRGGGPWSEEHYRLHCLARGPSRAGVLQLVLDLVGRRRRPCPSRCPWPCRPCPRS